MIWLRQLIFIICNRILLDKIRCRIVLRIRWCTVLLNFAQIWIDFWMQNCKFGTWGCRVLNFLTIFIWNSRFFAWFMRLIIGNLVILIFLLAMIRKFCSWFYQIIHSLMLTLMTLYLSCLILASFLFRLTISRLLP